MSKISFFKPNKKNTGCVFFLDAVKFPDAKEPSIVMKAVLQASWSDGKGTFKDNLDKQGKNVIVKLSPMECAAMISVIDAVTAFSPTSPSFIEKTINNPDCQKFSASFYHTSKNGASTTSLKPAEVREGEIYPKGFWLSILKDKSRFSIPLSLAEAQYLKQFLTWFSNSCFDYLKKVNDSFSKGRDSSDAPLQKRSESKEDVVVNKKPIEKTPLTRVTEPSEIEDPFGDGIITSNSDESDEAYENPFLSDD